MKECKRSYDGGGGGEGCMKRPCERSAPYKIYCRSNGKRARIIVSVCDTGHACLCVSVYSCMRMFLSVRVPGQIIWCICHLRPEREFEILDGKTTLSNLHFASAV